MTLNVGVVLCCLLSLIDCMGNKLLFYSGPCGHRVRFMPGFWVFTAGGWSHCILCVVCAKTSFFAVGHYSLRPAV